MDNYPVLLDRVEWERLADLSLELEHFGNSCVAHFRGWSLLRFVRSFIRDQILNPRFVFQVRSELFFMMMSSEWKFRASWVWGFSVLLCLWLGIVRATCIVEVIMSYSGDRGLSWAHESADSWVRRSLKLNWSVLEDFPDVLLPL